MAARTFASKLSKVISHGFSAGCGASITYYLIQRSKENEAALSWTTNYTPSVKWDSNWDKMAPESVVKPLVNNSDPVKENKYNAELEKHKSKAVRHLILIRHGQYELDGKTDNERVLTALGQRQADFTGNRLNDLSLPYTSIIHSTMTRAKETASIIHKHLPSIPMSSCPLLEEGAPIPPEPPVGHWRPEKAQFFRDGARIEAAFRKYFHRAPPSQKEDSYEIFVCHANVIRYFVCRAMQFPPEAWLRIALANGSITTLSIHASGQVRLSSLGTTGYMPPQSITHN